MNFYVGDLVKKKTGKDILSILLSPTRVGVIVEINDHDMCKICFLLPAGKYEYVTLSKNEIEHVSNE